MIRSWFDQRVHKGGWLRSSPGGRSKKPVQFLQKRVLLYITPCIISTFKR
jgi:hypothetical protein